jgi:hypothetical protein
MGALLVGLALILAWAVASLLLRRAASRPPRGMPTT